MSGLFRSTVIPGNKLTDFAATTAQVGIPIPFGYGEYVVGGNILWAHLPPKENVTRRRQGKGGVKTETYTYTLSYAVSFGLGPVSSYKWIERQGKIVYTTDPNAPVEDKEYAQKWLQRATIHLGGKNQLPDSTIEAVEGSGQVSAFKHLTYIVLEEEDVTESGGAPPNYRACLYRGSAKSYTTPPYPITTSSKAGLSVEFTSGEIRTVVRDAIAQEAEANLFIAFTGGTLKPPIVDAFAEQTETNLSIAFVGGMLKSPIVDADAEATESNLHIAFKDSELKTVVLNAKMQTTESNLEINFTGGSLYVP